MQFKNYLNEATLVNHPDRGIEIRPSGGLGSWAIERLVKDVVEQLHQLAQKVKNEDFAGAEHILFKSGTFKAKLSALARYDEFKTKNGKRKIAQGKEIDLGEGISESEMKYQALSMAKELHSALAALTFIEMLSVMDPKNPAKKEVQELETMINQLTTNVGEFIQKYIPDVADAETGEVDELPDEESDEDEDLKDKIKPKAIPKPKEKLKSQDDSDESKEDKMNKVKDKKPLKENTIKMKTFKEFLLDEGMKDTIEAHGIRGMKRTPWRKTFKDAKALNSWVEKNDSVEVLGTRDLEQAKRGNLSASVDEAINANDYIATSELIKQGGFRAIVKHKKNSSVMYAGQYSYDTTEKAQDAASIYLNAYERRGPEDASNRARVHAKFHGAK